MYFMKPIKQTIFLFDINVNDIYLHFNMFDSFINNKFFSQSVNEF